MLISYNADLLPKVRMLGQIRYNEPWIHFSRCINEWVLYVIRDGNLYLQEDGVRYHLAAGDFFLLEPGLTHEGYQRSACDYYYVHFSHPDMGRMEDETAAMAALADKRRKSLTRTKLPPGAPPAPRFAGPWLALYLLTNLSLIIATHAVGLPSIRVGASFISYHCARSVALAFRCRPSVS